MKKFLIATAILTFMAAAAFPLIPSFVPKAIKEYKTKADAGDAEAQYLYSIALLNGDGITRDTQQAFVYAKKAVDQGYERAIRLIGLCYENGYGVESNAVKAAECYSRALVWAKKAADEGDADAKFMLGLCHVFGNGVAKDLGEAVKWFHMAAEQGYVRAQDRLGNCYEYGEGVETNMVEAVKWYRKAAEQGHAHAQFSMGDSYFNGEGVEKDMNEAIKWYRKAAEQEYAPAQFSVGFCYFNGKGVEKDVVEAVKWYRKAAEQGHAHAQFNVGFSYFNGMGVEKDVVEAVKWYRKAAEQGNEYAQLGLGGCFLQGNGVERDLVEAAKWLRKSAEQGNEYAQFCPGGCYFYGMGVEKDKDEAAKWYRKAAKQGNVEAKKELTNMGLVFLEDIRAEFNGVRFAENISKYGEAKRQDNSNDRRFMSKSGEHNLSFQYVKYYPNRQFRMFSVGEIRATWESGVVYEVTYTYKFDRETTTAVDREEVKQTLAALTRKYGKAFFSSNPDDTPDRFKKDVREKFKSGDMVVTLDYTSEGSYERGSMELTAHCPALKKMAESESLKYYEKRMSSEASKVKAGGEDTL